MKTKFFTRIFVTLGMAIFGFMLTRAHAQDVASPLPMAVFDFQTADRLLDKRGSEVATLLNAHLSISPDVFLVERQEIDKILGEQEAGLAGAISAETAAKVGNLVGAKVLVTGRVFESSGKVFVVAKVIGTETGRVFGEMATAKDFASVDQTVEELAGKIIQLTKKQAATFVAKVEDPAARIERLKKLVAGKTLPAVSVSVVEQHLSRPVIDPAVQTELLLVLKQVGFPIVSPEEIGSRTDVVIISGEAFSELGGRRGNLVSCRARVELTVKQAPGKKLLFVERQNDVAIDVAEHIAGKRALENAALKLLDRIVPQLAPAS